MNAIRSLRHRAEVTQAELARSAGTSQSAIAAYETGSKSPTLDTLTRLARGVGLEAMIAFHPPLTREERRSLALHRAIAARVEQDPKKIVERARRNVTRMRRVASGRSQPLREWAVLLDRPLPALLQVLLDPSPWARELRHTTPFAGVLSARERAEVLHAFARSEGAAR